MNAGKRIEIVRPLFEFLSTLAVGVLVFVAVFPLIKHLGFPSLEKFNDLLPLNRFTAALTNSIFLYLSGCVTIFTVGVLYQVLVLNQLATSWGWNGVPRAVSTEPRQNVGASRCLPALTYSLRGPGSTGPRSNPFARTYGPYLRYFYWLADTIILFVLVILVFRNDASYFDYSTILGAVNDVMLGKDILADVIVSYGFFNVYFIAGFFDLFKVQDYYVGLSMIVSVLYVLGYGGIYFFLRTHTTNLFLSATVFFTIVYIDFYCLHIPIHWTPQSTFLRFGAYLPVFFLLYFLEKRKERGVERALEWLFAVVTAVLCFWAVEYGLYILVALIGVTACRFISSWAGAVSRAPWPAKAMIQGGQTTTRPVPLVQGCVKLRAGHSPSPGYKWLYRLARIFIVIAGIVIFLTIRIYLKYGHAPTWTDLFYFQRLYSQSGLAMTQLSSLGLWVIPVFIYAATVYFCLKYPKDIRCSDVWLFLSFFGLESFLYFVGKGGGFVLARVVIPAIILVAVFLSSIVRNDVRLYGGDKNIPLKYFVYIFMIGVCLTLSAAIKKEGRLVSLWSLISRNPGEFIESGKISSLERFLKNKNNFKRFQFDVAMIQRLVDAGQPLTILSKNDTLYYIYARRKSTFKNAFYPHFLTRRQINGMADTILEANPQFLFMDNSSFQVYDNLVAKQNPKVFSLVSQNFTKRVSLGFLDVYERIQ